MCSLEHIYSIVDTRIFGIIFHRFLSDLVKLKIHNPDAQSILYYAACDLNSIGSLFPDPLKFLIYSIVLRKNVAEPFFHQTSICRQRYVHLSKLLR